MSRAMKWCGAAFQACVLALVIAVVLLSGCSGAKDDLVRDTPRVVEPVEAKPPAEAMVQCARATALDDDSFGAVVRKLGEVLGLLEECAGKHGQLVDFVKEPVKP